jgi:hypothetical protein
MITFWIDNFKHFYGLRPNASFKFDYKHGCPSYFNELFLLYGIDFDIKKIKEDKPDPNKINICLIPAQGKPGPGFLHEQIIGATIAAKDNILWCYDHGIKVVIDRSREQAPWNIYDMIQYLDTSGYIDPFHFRILVNKYSLHDHVRPHKPIHSSLIIESNFFMYEMGGLCHNYIKSDKIYSLNIKPKKSEKKYKFISLFGEIRKPQRLLLANAMLEKNMLKDSYWTTVLRYSDDNVKANFSDSIQWFKYLYGDEQYDYIVKDRRFDSGKLDNMSDRITPEQAFESDLWVGIESSYKWNFYTEKSFKPIALEMPYIIFGRDIHNDCFCKDFNFEKHDELFDYSLIEKGLYLEDFESLDRHAKRFCEVLDTCNNPYNNITKEKCKHNKDVFLQKTSKDNFVRFVNEVFDSW